MDFDPKRDYPLGTQRPDLVSTPGGMPLTDVTLDSLRAGRIDGSEIRATPETLLLQSQVARAAGREPLATSLERAAGEARCRRRAEDRPEPRPAPRRATAAQLEEWAARLESHGADRTAGFVREAAGVYAERGLLADA